VTSAGGSSRSGTRYGTRGTRASRRSPPNAAPPGPSTSRGDRHLIDGRRGLEREVAGLVVADPCRPVDDHRARATVDVLGFSEAGLDDDLQHSDRRGLEQHPVRLRSRDRALELSRPGPTTARLVTPARLVRHRPWPHRSNAIIVPSREVTVSMCRSSLCSSRDPGCAIERSSLRRGPSSDSSLAVNGSRATA
jgi:hypothetical protein